MSSSSGRKTAASSTSGMSSSGRRAPTHAALKPATNSRRPYYTRLKKMVRETVQGTWRRGRRRKWRRGRRRDRAEVVPGGQIRGFVASSVARSTRAAAIFRHEQSER
jgi:hypothetical protein